jgi:hypothetical protein
VLVRNPSCFRKRKRKNKRREEARSENPDLPENWNGITEAWQVVTYSTESGTLRVTLCRY